MKKLIKVTQEHIDTGERGMPFSCPIANACCDVFPEAERIGISNNEVLIDDGGFMSSYFDKLPASAIKFMDDFDNEQLVQPFEFELYIPYFEIV